MSLVPICPNGDQSESSSPGRKGFAIGSLPSVGLIRTSSVPRTTTRPRDRVVSLPSSSAGERESGRQRKGGDRGAYKRKQHMQGFVVGTKRGLMLTHLAVSLSSRLGPDS